MCNGPVKLTMTVFTIVLLIPILVIIVSVVSSLWFSLSLPFSVSYYEFLCSFLSPCCTWIT